MKATETLMRHGYHYGALDASAPRHAQALKIWTLGCQIDAGRITKKLHLAAMAQFLELLNWGHPAVNETAASRADRIQIAEEELLAKAYPP